jgi:hypothetical protein
MKRNVLKITIVLAVFFLLCTPNLISPAFATQENIEKTKKQKVTVSTAQHSTTQNIPINDPLIELSLEEAEQLKKRFINLEHSYSGEEKIKEQLNILREIGVISSGFTFSLLVSNLEKMKNSCIFPSFFFRYTRFSSGPMIVSHFTIGDRIKCILPLKTPRFYYHIINKSNIDGYAGILPFYFGYSYNPVFVTAFGFNLPESYNKLFFTFFELLIPCIGISIAFLDDSDSIHSRVIFEYNLDICFMGTFFGFGV